MLGGKTVLAVVPARSGSKGVPHKNLREVAGVSLIGHAARVLNACSFIDAAILSTDSQEYADEGVRRGLAVPFLRPPELSGDTARAIDVMQHAIVESEKHFERRFDILLIIEPTSPMRTPRDLEEATQLLVDSGADSVLTVSPVPTKSHPLKLLTVEDGHVGFFAEAGGAVVNRQEIQQQYFCRDGLCYALTRACVMEKAAIITSNTRAHVTTRTVINIDEPLELVWAEYLMARQNETGTGGT